MKKSVVCAAIATSLIAAPCGSASLGSVNPSQFSITLRGHVTVVCRTQFTSSPMTTETGFQSLGLVNEFCNSSRGYPDYRRRKNRLER